MFIKRTKRTLRGKTYANHLLVESVATERGPRHRVICSLGSLGPAPKAQWLKLAHHLQESLGGQESLLEHSAEEQALVEKATLAAKGKKKRKADEDINIDLEEVCTSPEKTDTQYLVSLAYYRRNRVTLSPEPPGIFRFGLAPAGAGRPRKAAPPAVRKAAPGARGASPQGSILRCGR